MHRTRVAVLRGGPSSEYEVSLKTGTYVLNNLSNDKYHARDVLIDRRGIWHMNGVATLPHDVLTHVDVVFNALHGHFGEDGKVQHILESHGIPFTGSTSFASAVGMNKEMSKKIYRDHKLKTPLSKVIKKDKDLNKIHEQIFQSFSLPIIIKPLMGGSSIGLHLVKDWNSLSKVLETMFEKDNDLLVEEFIKGKEASCGVIDDFRTHRHYALPAIETLTHLVPGNFSDHEKKELERLSIEAHKILGLRHYSNSDFIIHPVRGIFILETNTLPSLTEESLIPKALSSVGASMSHFLDHIIQLALSRK